MPMSGQRFKVTEVSQCDHHGNIFFGWRKM